MPSRLAEVVGSMVSVPDPPVAFRPAQSTAVPVSRAVVEEKVVLKSTTSVDTGAWVPVQLVARVRASVLAALAPVPKNCTSENMVHPLGLAAV